MANYEIMLVVSGSIDEKAAKKVADEISSSIKECKPKLHEYGSKQLAYKIKKDTTGYYFQYNFECESPTMINEFRRLSSINKQVLRTLIINLEKDYGYRASVNPKKIQRNKKRAEIHAQIKAEIEKARAEKQSGIENTKIEKPVVDAKPVKEKPETSTKPKKAKASDIPVDKKHEVVSMKEFEDYNYDKRRKEWHKKAGHNEKQEVCSICKDDDNWASVLLENGKHVCYYCWIKKPETLEKLTGERSVDAAATSRKKRTTKK